MLLPGCGPQKDLHQRGDGIEIILAWNRIFEFWWPLRNCEILEAESMLWSFQIWDFEMHLYVEPGLDHFNMLQPPGLFFLLRSRTDEFHSTLVVVSLPVAVSGLVYFASCFYVQRGACKNHQKVYKFRITSIWMQWHVPGVNTCPNNSTETIMGKNHNQKMNMNIIPAQLVGSRFCFWHTFLTSQNSCRVVFNVSVTVCVVSHLNLCLCHVTVPNSLVSLHKAVLGVQDGQSDIDFSSFWRSFLLKCHGEQ